MRQTLVLFALAIGLRVWIVAQPDLGFENDLALFTRWMQGLVEHGLAGFYASEDFCDYPPLALLLFYGVGAFLDAVFTEPGARVFHAGVKTLACLADIGIGALLFHEARKLIGPSAGVLAAGFYLLNPVSLYDSAYWGQVDAIYTFFLLGSLLLVRRQRWGGAGLLAGLALAAKFQALVVLPLVLFEAARLARARGVARLVAGSVLGLSIAVLPFVVTGTFPEMVGRAYIGVVGQYHDMSSNAYNIWYLFGEPGAPDTAPPHALVRIAAGGQETIAASGSWLLGWTWRKISLVIFSLSVAVVLSLYGRRPGNLARYGAAGLLALCFYLFPTEIHERYAFPVIAFLAVWAAARPSHERIYWALSIALLLNLAAVFSPAPLAPQIAVATLVLFVSILVWMVWPRAYDVASWGREEARQPERAVPENALPEDGLPENAFMQDDVPEHSIPADPTPDAGCGGDAASSADGTSRPIRVLQIGTVVALLLACLAGGIIHTWAWHAASRTGPEEYVWLSDATLRTAEQGWGELRSDRAVSGASMRLGDVFYLRGVGTHAPATLVYEVPPGSRTFETWVGIDRGTRGEGSFRIRVDLDGRIAYQSPVLTGTSAPVPIEVDVRGAETLTLAIDPTADGERYDHVNLALARFRIAPIESEVVAPFPVPGHGGPASEPPAPGVRGALIDTAACLAQLQSAGSSGAGAAQ